MADDHSNLTGLQSVWPYCEARIQKNEVNGHRWNQNYECIYRAFNIWFDDKWLQFVMINNKDPSRMLKQDTIAWIFACLSLDADPSI